MSDFIPDHHTPSELPLGNILTLEEAAKYLRVSPDKLEREVEEEQIPAQSVGGEWRLLKSALDERLKYGAKGFDKPAEPKRGSKEALMKYFGIFRDEENPEELLSTLRALRTEGDR